MASTALANSALEQINGLTQLPLVRQAGFMVVLAATIALATSVVLWSQDDDYVVLFPEASTQDNAEVVGALDAARIRYRVDPANGLVSVPARDVQTTRLQLATQGLPRSSGAGGYGSLTESSAIGTSNFIEQARYNRALEQELVTTIKLIRGVRDARVHLSIPKQTTFLRTGNKPSASVMLDIIGGQTISDIQIAGIAHLVASSVAGLESENVSIVDQKGSLLSRQQGSELNGSSEQMRYTRALEDEYTQRILALLTPIVGEGRIRAQVTADLDFTVVETTSENYDPNRTVLRSEQSQQETRGTSGTLLPGELSPTPPTDAAGNVVAPETPVVGQPADQGSPIAGAQAAAQAVTQNQIQAGNQQRLNTTRNYEIDRSVSHSRTVPGGIKRLSVAVVVDLQSGALATSGQGDAGQGAASPATALTPEQQAERLARLTQLVKDTVGFSDMRGDSVNVIAEVFTPQQLAMFEEEAPLPVWQQPWVASAARQAAASIVVLLLIFSVLRPALRSVVTRPAAPVQAAPMQISVNHENLRVAEADPPPLPNRSVFDENLQAAQNIVRSEPARAARMIKDWVASD